MGEQPAWSNRICCHFSDHNRPLVVSIKRSDGSWRGPSRFLVFFL